MRGCVKEASLQDTLQNVFLERRCGVDCGTDTDLTRESVERVRSMNRVRARTLNIQGDL